MRVVADENGWELVESLDAAEPRPAAIGASSMPPVSATVSSNAPGSGVFRKLLDGRAGPPRDGAEEDEATMATDPAPASGEEAEVRLPAPARLPPDLTGDKTRVA